MSSFKVKIQNKKKIKIPKVKLLSALNKARWIWKRYSDFSTKVRNIWKKAKWKIVFWNNDSQQAFRKPVHAIKRGKSILKKAIFLQTKHT